MDPVAFRLGPIPVHWYGIIILTGAVLGATLSGQIAKRRGRDPEHIWNMLAVILLLGIIGARAYHVFSQPAPGAGIGWDYYKENPIDAIAFWKGIETGQFGFSGLGIYGGIVGGIIGVALYTWYAKLDFLEWVDIAVPGLLLAQGIGRWGNFVNQELFGPPTTLPWGINIDCTRRFGEFMCPPNGTLAADTLFHPTFLYESLWSLAGVALLVLLVWKWDDWLRTGDLLLVYLIYYPMGRFWIELFFRPDAWTLGSLPTASIISLLSMAIGAAGLIYNHRFRPKPAPEPIQKKRGNK
ncbi:MAG: prolipoprotein diacylglyceryl transferase [Chloroflexi bacterium]|nr:prolipoprotein diacylglyceryl transferase [Chloroflexota bacterium]